MRRWIGRWIAAVGVIHVGVGFLLFSDPLLAIVRDGIFDAVDGHPGRPLAFWFVFLGFLTIIFGMLFDRLEAERVRLPSAIGWGFFALVLLGIVTMPVGGGWLLLPAGIGAVIRTRRT